MAEQQKHPKRNLSVAESFGIIASSMKRSTQGMGNWGIEELTLGLYKVSNKHLRDRIVDTIEGTTVTSREELLELLFWLRWAMSAYESDTYALSQTLKVPRDFILKHSTKSDIHKPAYFIGANHTRKLIVLSIRGTSEASDILTDLTSHSHAFEGGYAHSGMLESANWIFLTERNFLRETLYKFQGYGFVVTGHSLGAGTAALLTCLVREGLGSDMPAQQGELTTLGVAAGSVQCWAYACPPCVDVARAAKCSGFIKSIVLQDDVVARVSPAALEDLRLEILSTDWKDALGDDSTALRIVEMADRSRQLLKKFEKGAGFKEGHFFDQMKSHGLQTFSSVGQRIIRSTATTTTTRTSATSSWFSTASKLVGTVVEIATSEAIKSAPKEDGEEVGKPVDLEEVKRRRLFVPGTLYHIMRKPAAEAAVPRTSVEELADWERAKGDDMEEIVFWAGKERNLNGEPESSGEAGPVRYVVVKGSNPQSRFKRIILSSTMLSDHVCRPYAVGIVNAMQWT